MLRSEPPSPRPPRPVHVLPSPFYHRPVAALSPPCHNPDTTLPLPVQLPCPATTLHRQAAAAASRPPQPWRHRRSDRSFELLQASLSSQHTAFTWTRTQNLTPSPTPTLTATRVPTSTLTPTSTLSPILSPSFSLSLSLSPTPIPPPAPINQAGLYSEHIATWLRHFPSARLLVLSSAELWNFPEQACCVTAPRRRRRAAPDVGLRALARNNAGGMCARLPPPLLHSTPSPQVLRRFERFVDLPPASYRFSAKHVLPHRGSENSAPPAGAHGAALPIDTALRLRLETFLAPFNRKLAVRTGIHFL